MKENKQKRKTRVRSKIQGTSNRPRMSVFRSNRKIYVQIIDDSKGVTLVAKSSGSVKGKKPIEVARQVGVELAKKVLAKKIKGVVFDRGGYKYHGKVKAIAEGAREGGLKL